MSCPSVTNEMLDCNNMRATLHLCPIERGETFPPLVITPYVKRGSEWGVLDVVDVKWEVYKYGKLDFTLPTILNDDGVITVKSVSGEVTSKWAAVTYKYKLIMQLSNGRVVHYLSGNMPVGVCK